MFTSFMDTITSTKFQVNQLTLTLFSGSGPKKPARWLTKSQNAVDYRVKFKTDQIYVKQRWYKSA